MANNTKLMSLVFNFEDNPLVTREYPSDIMRFNTFSTVQTNTTIWTPTSGKNIFLTAMQISASVPMVISLNRGGNIRFMSVILTSSFATFSESFTSPIKFLVDEAITLTTNVAGTVNITLFGYEIIPQV